MTKAMRRFPLLTISIVACAVTALAAPAPLVNATGDVTTRSVEYLDVSIDAKGSIGKIGIEYDGPAVDPLGGYADSIMWRSDGTLMKVDHQIGPTFLKPKYDVEGLPIESSSTKVRLEAYPRNTTDCSGYDWQAPCYWENYSVENSVYGGFHMTVVRQSDGSWPHVGTITVPTVNDRYKGFIGKGSILASSEVTDGRVQVDAFQIDCWITEACPPRPTSSGGIQYGAFSSGRSGGETWFTSVSWPGRYTMFISDLENGQKVQVIADISEDDMPAIDLDAPCFGFKECVTLAGNHSPSAPPSNFHPLPPTRILDTRSGIGIPNGPVRPGDGSIDTTNDDFRTDEELNHELVVTGHDGVPEHGVAAVLLNITAVNPSGNGFVTVGPRPQGRGDVFNDQNSYGEWPNASNLNFVAGQTVPNLVLVRVGAGGRIRFHARGATTHLLADIAGYFTYGSTGSGFTSVDPTRLFDSRQSSEDPFYDNSLRTIQVTGRASIPESATSVVVNLTATNPTARGFVTAFPAGTLAPNASNLNLRAGETRPNLAVVSLSSSGAIELQTAFPHDSDGFVDLIVDVFGYFSDDGGERTTTTEPFRIVDTRSGIGGANLPFGSDEIRSFRGAGTGGIPAEVTAIWANVTVISPTSNGFLSAYPSGTTTPYVSNLNWKAGDINPNMALIPLNSQGNFDVAVTMPWDSSGKADVLVDVLGWVSPS